MPMEQEMIHPRSMTFENQRLAFMLRKDQKLPWQEITERVVNRLCHCRTHCRIADHRPSVRQVREVCQSFDKKIGHRAYKYKNCGRYAHKVTKDVEKFILQKMLAMRRAGICTATCLQGEVAREMNVKLDASTIRKVLGDNGYRWRRRAQKPRYSKEDMERRLAFVRRVLAMAKKVLAKMLSMATDGVVLSLAPSNPTKRWNFCRDGETHMWRSKEEAAKAELAGADAYSKQVPLARALPMWGGIGRGGFGLVMFHEFKKVNNGEWVKAISEGSLRKALHAAAAPQTRGPWTILCDNESFLDAPASKKAHARQRITLMHIPPRSPDLNPVEMYWAWVRKQLRAKELADMHAKRPPLNKFAMKARVHALLRTAAAKRAAQRHFWSFRKTCAIVQKKKGAASGKQHAHTA